MSSYFDARTREVAEAAEQFEQDASFLARVQEIEEKVFGDVARITGDREFPSRMREQAMNLCALQSARVIGECRNPKAEARALATRSSAMIEALHSLFHEVARARIQTRFGLLSDDPIGDAERRDAEDTAGYGEG